MTDIAAIAQLAAGRSREGIAAISGAVRIAEIEERLRELDGIDRQLAASRRRYTLRHFEAWQVLAKARKRKVVDAVRRAHSG